MRGYWVPSESRRIVGKKNCCRVKVREPGASIAVTPAKVDGPSPIKNGETECPYVRRCRQCSQAAVTGGGSRKDLDLHAYVSVVNLWVGCPGEPQTFKCAHVNEAVCTPPMSINPKPIPCAMCIKEKGDRDSCNTGQYHPLTPR